VGSVLFSTNESSMLADKVEAVWHDKGLGLVHFDPTVGLRSLMSIYQDAHQFFYPMRET